MAKEPAGLKLPPPIDEAWHRLANRGGSGSDLKKVLAFLAKLWAPVRADRAFDEWLVSHGLVKKGLPLPMLHEHQKTFEREHETTLKQTRDLIEGLTLGPHSREGFTSLGGFSTELKRLAYRTAISVSRDEALVFVLVALSQESPQLAQEWVSDLPGSPVLQVFLAYLKSSRLPLALDEQWSALADPNGVPIFRLFRLATLPLKTLQDELRSVPRSEIETLARLAESLLERVSDRGFGKFVQLNVSVFICIADPNSKSVDRARQYLVSTGEPAIAEILTLMGKDHLLAELRATHHTEQPRRERFLAAVIDACRKYYSESIRDFQKDLEPYVGAKVPVLALAARAALLQSRPQDESKFEKFLLARLRTDREHSVSEWLLRNPEFIRYIRVEQTPLKTLKAILEVCKVSKPALALKIEREVRA